MRSKIVPFLCPSASKRWIKSTPQQWSNFLYSDALCSPVPGQSNSSDKAGTHPNRPPYIAFGTIILCPTPGQKVDESPREERAISIIFVSKILVFFCTSRQKK